jgi:hypothetical protein
VHSGVTAEECAPFVANPTHVIAYHYICNGRMTLELDGHEPVVVEAGEVVLLPQNEPHRLGSAPGLPPVNAEEFMEPGEGGQLARIVYGCGGEQTRMLCGFLSSEVPNYAIIRVLPKVL